MTLLEIIRQRYPDAQADDFEITQDGTELRLEHWDVRQDGEFTKRPDESELRAWIDQVEQTQLRTESRERALQRFAAVLCRGLVGRHFSKLTPEEELRLLKAKNIMSGIFDAQGRVKPVNDWPTYREDL